MSHFELVGLFDCPWYAKAEKIADEIVAQNPAIEFHKEMLEPMHFKEFAVKMNIRQGWDIQRSPCIYEVLADREGKAHLIGDISDFCEFALLYFDIQYDPTSSALKDMVIGNRAVSEKNAFESVYGRAQHGGRRRDAEIFYICIVNAPLQMLELLVSQLLSSCTMIPYGLVLHISIFDEYTPKRILDGLTMEITDMASPLLYKVRVATTLPTAFYRCHLFLLMEDFSRTLMEESRDWLDRVEFKVVRIMNSFNSTRNKITDCRILVGGEGPSCYVAEICRKMAPYSSCSQGKVLAAGQHVVQRAKAELGKIGKLSSGSITRLHCYGWPGETGCYVEVKDAVVRSGNYSMRGPGVEIPLAEIATRSNYIFTQFSKDYLSLQKQRLAYIIKQPNRTMSMAESTISTVHTWLMCDPLVRLMGEGVTGVTASTAGVVVEGMQQIDSCLPVINAGVECGVTGDLPAGVFMVQPAICINGKWQPLGRVSPKTSARILYEVNKLWDIRQKLIYRDLDITAIFPDYVKMATGVDPIKVAEAEEAASLSASALEKKGGLKLPKLGEFGGEGAYAEDLGEGGSMLEENEAEAYAYDLTSDEN